jgi:hypothetical protein
VFHFVTAPIKGGIHVSPGILLCSQAGIGLNKALLEWLLTAYHIGIWEIRHLAHEGDESDGKHVKILSVVRDDALLRLRVPDDRTTWKSCDR